ncbi:flagellar biosynthesis regulator FlaF [Rubrimonas cliftonensis]|uniref:Flagellar protein FlaF n=1 Tax=Rubrimonas cliftonensis TaxID=89524 RepID=A0A1H4GM35_9RHOB|nr:flagellar biosynthesis regulator FlaF [Rubrimonas cliftonensis]SEB09908.1 flagellar protein FlaF [Rubrimonas cliftonensis]
MNASALAQSAYGPRTGGAQTARESEYQVFLRVTAALSAARNGGAFGPLCEALNQNVRLWTTLASDVAAPENGLPQALRAQIASLAVFSIRQSFAVIAGEGGVDALIDVNQAVMKGLRGAPANTA